MYIYLYIYIFIYFEKVANELRTFGWEIDGQSVVAAHKAAME